MRNRTETLLADYEKRKKKEPDLTYFQHALRVGLPYPAYMARINEALMTAKRVASVETESRRGAVLTIACPLEIGQSQKLLLMSDNHHDHPSCNRSLEREHLEEAKHCNALVFSLGDWFDAMQGRFDPRRSMSELRPEYRTEKYYNVIVDDSAKFLQPFASNIKAMVDGNHCLSVLKNANIDILEMLTSKLGILHGGYGGWVKLQTGQRDINIKYYHGSGGEAPVTRGAIQTSRQAVYLPDADIVANGHSHNAYYIPIARERVSDIGMHYFDIQHHIRIPGYKQAYGDGSGGWEVTRGGVPKPVGCVWVTLTAKETGIKVKVDVDIEGPDPINFTQDGPFMGQVYAQDT